MDTAGAMAGARATRVFGLVLVVEVLFVSLLSIEAAEVSRQDREQPEPGPGRVRYGGRLTCRR